MAKVTGLGGVFHVASNPEATRAWYRDVLGIDGDYGPQLNWSEESGERPYSLISHFADDKYIQPGKGGFMINLRVDDCEAMVEQLKARGVEILGYVDEGYGRFAWLLDPDGIKIELWQQMEAP